MNKFDELYEQIEKSDKIVFFGGAGVSTESGIPDFRSVDGLYNQKYKYPPETILSRSFFCYHIADFYEFYKDKLLHLDAKPNKAHYALAELERRGKLLAIITQNIDGLHQAAGSKNVFELHGSVHRNYCIECGECHDAEYIKNSPYIPQCRKCEHLLKPDVVLYEEALNSETVNGAIEALEQADLLIVGGTSLAVYPASGLIDYYKGDKIILINKTPTPLDNRADLIIQDSIGKALSYKPEMELE